MNGEKEAIVKRLRHLADQVESGQITEVGEFIVDFETIQVPDEDEVRFTYKHTGWRSLKVSWYDPKLVVKTSQMW